MRIEYSGVFYGEEERENLRAACEEMHLTAGRWDRKFTEGLQEFLGVPAITTNSGSSANLLAVQSLLYHAPGLQPGDEVITSALGFPTTIAPILQSGLVPVFVDIDPETLNANPDAIERAIGPRTRAIMLAHTLGIPFDLTRVLELCQRHGLYLVEDNCDALGAEWEGKKTGTWGNVGTSSFYPAHHITTGEGGALYSGDRELLGVATSLRDWGRACWCAPGKDNTCGKRFGWKLGEMPDGYDHKYLYTHLGFNLKMTDFQAALGAAQVQKAGAFAKARLQNWLYVRAELGLSGGYDPRSRPSPYAVALWAKDRERTVRKLEEHGVQTRPPFAGNITRQPAMRGREYRKVGELGVTDRAMESVFFVGCHPGIGMEEREYLVKALKEAL